MGDSTPHTDSIRRLTGEAITPEDNVDHSSSLPPSLPPFIPPSAPHTQPPFVS